MRELDDDLVSCSDLIELDDDPADVTGKLALNGRLLSLRSLVAAVCSISVVLIGWKAEGMFVRSVVLGESGIRLTFAG